jgi:hypothetical protein
MHKYLKLIIRIMLLFSPVMTAYGISEETVPEEGTTESFDRVQVSFIANKGQIENKEAAYFVRLTDRFIYVDKKGVITYTFSSPGKNDIVIHEIVSGKNISVTPLEPLPERVIAVMRQKGKLDGGNLNYYRISYGAIREGIELQLLAFTDTLEKIFTISPGGDPGSIAVKLKGVEGAKVNDAGELEIVTKQGPVKFGPPHAYQFVGEERKPVDVAYTIRKNATYGFKLGNYDKAQPLFIAPIIPAFLLSAP